MSDGRSPWQKRLPRILIGVFVLLLAWALVRQLEWVEEEVDLGPTAEAKRNPFLASQRLLEQYDIPHHTEHGFSNLREMQWQDKPIGQNDTLVLINTYHNLHERQVERLWRWVADGGRLIVSAENPFIGIGEHLRDPLLARMGLTLHSNHSFSVDHEGAHLPDEDAQPGECTPPEEITEAEPETAPGSEEAVLEDHEVIEDDELFGDEAIADGTEDAWTPCSLLTSVPVTLSADEPKLVLNISNNSYFSIKDESAEVLAGDEETAFSVRQQHGRGEIVAITNAIAWQNSYIGCNDNAYIFWRLTHDSPRVWYAINVQTPSFWRQLWQLSAAGCVALLLALAFWLWTAATRFGPILQPPHSSGGQFIDHIRAAAKFTQRHQGQEALVEVLRDDIAHCAQKRYPGFGRLSRREKISVLHKICGVTQSDIDFALFHPLPLSESQFLDVVRRLQHLRNRL